MIADHLQRLVDANIQLLPITEMPRHFVFERGGFIALVERQADGFGNIGSAGLATEQGFAALQWRGEQAYFVARGFEQMATPQQIEQLRAFERDLKAALA